MSPQPQQGWALAGEHCRSSAGPWPTGANNFDCAKDAAPAESVKAERERADREQQRTDKAERRVKKLEELLADRLAGAAQLDVLDPAELLASP